MSTSAELYRELEICRTAVRETFALYTQKLNEEMAALSAEVAAPAPAAVPAAEPVAAEPAPATPQELQRARWRLEKRPEWQGKDAATRRQMIQADVLSWRTKSAAAASAPAPALPGFPVASMPRMNLRAPIPSHFTPEQAAALEKRRAADREYARKKRLADKESREYIRKVTAEAAALRAEWALREQAHAQAQAQVA